ncbi:MAG: hypothetical protein V9H69_10495 [Anaerolineae bacterium]
MLVHLFGFEDAATYKQWQALGPAGEARLDRHLPDAPQPQAGARDWTRRPARSARCRRACAASAGSPVHGLEDTVPIPGFQGQGI